MSPFLKRALGPQHNNQGTQILARTLYKELRANGCDTGEVLARATGRFFPMQDGPMQDGPMRDGPAPEAR